VRRGEAAAFGRSLHADIYGVIERYRDRDIPKFFRGDSAFALPKLFALLEREGFRYAIRLKSNAVLERKIARWMIRPVSRPSVRPKVCYHNVRYRAGSWDQARRVVVRYAVQLARMAPGKMNGAVGAGVTMKVVKGRSDPRTTG
jgi:hypothetical protein